jgi:hypothetical protein
MSKENEMSNEHKEAIRLMFNEFLGYDYEQRVAMFQMLGDMLLNEAREENELLETKKIENDLYVSKLERLRHAG